MNEGIWWPLKCLIVGGKSLGVKELVAGKGKLDSKQEFPIDFAMPQDGNYSMLGKARTGMFIMLMHGCVKMPRGDSKWSKFVDAV